MAIGVIATLSVQQGKNAEFEAAFAELAAQVRANEPGNVFYSLHRSQADAQVYKVLEQYRSQADLDAHFTAPYFAEANAVLAPMVAGAPQIEMLDAV